MHKFEECVQVYLYIEVRIEVYPMHLANCFVLTVRRQDVSGYINITGYIYTYISWLCIEPEVHIQGCPEKNDR